MYCEDDKHNKHNNTTNMCTSDSPRKRCKSHGVGNCDADPDHLFRVRCTKCDYVRDFDPNGYGAAAKYLYHRRRTRAARGLLSVGAPLDYPSAAYLIQAAAECGIASNTSQPHVTFVEGLVPDVDHAADIRRLRGSLFADSTLRVVSVHRVPRRDNSSDLILADVILGPGADEAAADLSADGRVCQLPQFPFHVALGACPKARGASKRAAQWAEARLKGMTLSLDPRRVRVLPPPPEGGKKMMTMKQGRRMGHQHRHQWVVHAQAHYQPAHMHVRHRAQHIYYPPTAPQQQMQQQQQEQWNMAPPGKPFPSREYHVASTPTPSVAYSESGDETDAASTSGSSSASEEVEAQFPGLSVDLAFLDELDDNDAAVSRGCAVEVSAPQMNNIYVPPLPTSIWAQA